MNNLSDIIEKYIMEQMKNAEQDIVEIQRNILANQFNCVPSQINYVLSTRFNFEKGYVVESRRGGGGFVRIYRIPYNNKAYLLHNIYNMIGDDISQPKAASIISRLIEEKIITRREGEIMLAIIDREILKTKMNESDQLRARILKVIINTICKKEGEAEGAV